MASPVINHVVSDWFEQGHCAEVLAAVREECQWRSQTIRARLASHGVRTQPNGFHAWLPLQAREDGHCVASDMADQLRSLGVAAVAGSTFSTDRNPPEGLRICMGGSLTRDDCGRALQAVVDALEHCQAGNTTT
jgi:DNA-binding transcriptional MocR family regulator